MKITYEEMTPAMQKAYRSTNTARKVTMFISLVLSAILIFAMYAGFSRNKSFFEVIFAVIPAAFGIGSMLHGLVHCEFAFKWLFRNLPLILALPGALFISFFGVSIGIPVVILDLVFFILKKPLIYPFEHKSLISLKSVQQEIATVEYQEEIAAVNSEIAMGKLANLNQLKEQGVITEEEFNEKKSELLKQI